MASRGMMQREAEQRASWASPGPASGHRPPSAPRERKPVLAALAILLIAGGALGTGYLVLQNGKREGAIEVSSVIAAGQQIKLADLSDVQVASNTNPLTFTPWTEVQQVTQSYARTTLYPGTLLTQEMAATSSGLIGTSARVGLALKDGQFPDQLAVGDIVNIFVDNTQITGCPVVPSLLARNATVLDIGSPPSGGTNTDVTVGIDPAETYQYGVTCNAANGNVSLVIQPGRGITTPVGPSPGPTNSSTGVPSTHPSRTPHGHPSVPTGPSSSPPSKKSSTPKKSSTSAKSSPSSSTHR
jgi:hypothetical protein